jgi:hypothetical protein
MCGSETGCERWPAARGPLPGQQAPKQARRLRCGVADADNTTVTLHSAPAATPHPVMTALARHVPLTLLLDLASPVGPESAHIHARETADLSWLTGLPASVAPTAAVKDRDASATG